MPVTEPTETATRSIASRSTTPSPSSSGPSRSWRPAACRSRHARAARARRRPPRALRPPAARAPSCGCASSWPARWPRDDRRDRRRRRRRELRRRAGAKSPQTCSVSGTGHAAPQGEPMTDQPTTNEPMTDPDVIIGLADRRGAHDDRGAIPQDGGRRGGLTSRFRRSSGGARSRSMGVVIAMSRRRGQDPPGHGHGAQHEDRARAGASSVEPSSRRHLPAVDHRAAPPRSGPPEPSLARLVTCSTARRLADDLAGVTKPNTAGIVALVEDTAVVEIREALPRPTGSIEQAINKQIAAEIDREAAAAKASLAAGADSPRPMPPRAGCCRTEALAARAAKHATIGEQVYSPPLSTMTYPSTRRNARGRRSVANQTGRPPPYRSQAP